MPLPIDEQDFPDSHSLEILDQVVLTSFKAEPSHIGPFGASHLSWKVEGPQGFQVRLNALPVGRAGDRIVQPASSTVYRLTAVAGQASKVLGTASVSVDATGCVTFEPVAKPRVTFAAALKAGALAEPGISLRSEPTVTFAPGRVSFALRLSKAIDWFPDPDVNIEASFGLGVVDGELVAIGEAVSADLTVPWYAWLAPGALPGLAIALDMGRDSARKSGHGAVEGLIQLLNFFTMPPSGKRVRTVRIDAGNGGDGIIEVTACPYDLLKNFAKVSGVAVIG